MLQDGVRAVCRLGHCCDAPWTALRIECALIGGVGNDLCSVGWWAVHPLQRARVRCTSQPLLCRKRGELSDGDA